jgi:hypothetical protein
MKRSVSFFLPTLLALALCVAASCESSSERAESDGASSTPTSAKVAAVTPSSVVREYFARMQAADISVVNLFLEDAELIGLGTRVSGSEAIHEFYDSTIRDSKPVPELRTLAEDGDVVFAEIMISVPGISPIHVVDRFEIRDGKIHSLTYFVAEYPQAAAPGS